MFNKANYGKAIHPANSYKDSSAFMNVRKTNSVTSAVLMKYTPGKDNLLLMTGTEEFDGKYTWYQVAFWKPLPTGEFFGYVRADVANIINFKPNIATMSEYGRMCLVLSNDLETCHTGIECRRLIKLLNAKGIDTTNWESQLKKITVRYNERQKTISSAKGMEVKRGVRSSYADEAEMAGPAVGEPITLIILLCIFLVTVIAAAFILKSIFGTTVVNDAAFDLENASTLKELLEKQDPATKAKVQEELNKEAKRNFEEGADAAAAEKNKSFLKLGILTTAGIFLGKYLFGEKPNKK